MASRTSTIAVLILAWVLAGVFLYAGLIKLLHPDALLTDIQSYDLVSYRIAYLATFYLPAIELVAALGLLLQKTRRESALLLLFLTLVFIAALSSAWARGIDISCGCFGKSEIKANYPWLIGRDVLIVLGCAGVLLLGRSRKQDGSLTEK